MVIKGVIKHKQTHSFHWKVSTFRMECMSAVFTTICCTILYLFRWKCIYLLVRVMNSVMLTVPRWRKHRRVWSWRMWYLRIDVYRYLWPWQTCTSGFSMLIDKAILRFRLKSFQSVFPAAARGDWSGKPEPRSQAERCTGLLAVFAILAQRLYASDVTVTRFFTGVG